MGRGEAAGVASSRQNMGNVLVSAITLKRSVSSKEGLMKRKSHSPLPLPPPSADKIFDPGQTNSSLIAIFSLSELQAFKYAEEVRRRAGPQRPGVEGESAKESEPS